MLKKIPRPNFTSSHQYHQVPLNGESDSEDDEALLYAAPSLNHHENGLSKRDSSFGVGVYDHSRDLDLPRVVQFPGKGKSRSRVDRSGQRLVQSKTFACIFVVLACILVAAIAAFAVLVAGNWNILSPSSANVTIPQGCTSVPKPLPEGTQQPCTESPPGSHEPQVTSVPPASNLPPSALPTSSTPSNAPPTQTIDTATPIPSEPTQADVEVSDEGGHSSSTVDAISSPDGKHSTDSMPVSSAPNPVPISPETGTATDHREPPSDDSNSVETVATTSSSSSSSGSNNNKVSDGTRFESLDISSPTPPAASTNSVEPSPQTDVAPEDGKVNDSSCFPVPSPLLNGPSTSSSMPSSSSPPVSLEPTPAISDWSSQDSQNVAIQTEPIAISTTQPISTDRPTTVANSEPSEETMGPVRTSTGKHPSSTNGKRLHWERSFLPGASEATPTTVDLDGDGVKERLLVVDVSMNYVTVFALNGMDGSTKWNRTVNFPVFGVHCLADISNDGVRDCFINGRGGGLGALSGSDGRPIWFVDESMVYPRYNFYFPLRVPDMDGDGVEDLVVTHGGDGAYEPEEHNRSPGLLGVVSGKTGQKLLEPVPMPDGKETYMSPILAPIHGSTDGDGVILFGSGGETVAGSLWGVSLSSLRDAVAAGAGDRSDKVYSVNQVDNFHPQFLPPNRVPPRPKLDPAKFDVDHLRKDRVVSASCPTWNGKQVPIWNGYDLCLYEFLRSGEKGVILPPVVVDVDVDGVEDLVVSTFNGHTMAIDGNDMKRRIWNTYFPGTESYRWVMFIGGGVSSCVRLRHVVSVSMWVWVG